MLISIASFSWTVNFEKVDKHSKAPKNCRHFGSGCILKPFRWEEMIFWRRSARTISSLEVETPCCVSFTAYTCYETELVPLVQNMRLASFCGAFSHSLSSDRDVKRIALQLKIRKTIMRLMRQTLITIRTQPDLLRRASLATRSLEDRELILPAIRFFKCIFKRVIVTRRF